MLQSLRGFQDFYGDKSKLFSYVTKEIIAISNRYGYSRIYTPLLESSSLFLRSGDDLVSKEMYTFKDRGDRDVSLVPEGTASVTRAVLENNIPTPAKLFYISPFFRYERPQKGRFRQFHQFGIEIVGIDNIYADVEAILLASNIFTNFNIPTYIEINHLGSVESQNRYSEYLKGYFKNKDLCGDCKDRYEKNILRILDCKNSNCKDISEGADSIDKFLREDEREDFNKILSILKDNKIEYKVSSNLVRGLDYYTGIVFEVKSSLIDKAVAGGGRYNNLYREIGNRDIGAVGFAIGLERLMDLTSLQIEEGTDIYIAVVEEKYMENGINIANILRSNKIKVDMELRYVKFKKQLSKASEFNAKYTLIIGEEEINSGKLSLKNMNSGEQKKVNVEDILKEIEL